MHADNHSACDKWCHPYILRNVRLPSIAVQGEGLNVSLTGILCSMMNDNKVGLTQVKVGGTHCIGRRYYRIYYQLIGNTANIACQ